MEGHRTSLPAGLTGSRWLLLSPEAGLCESRAREATERGLRAVPGSF